MCKIFKFFCLIYFLVAFNCFGQIGTITTFAGNGIGGHLGDGGLATAAEIFTPISGAFDGNGNYYFSQRFNNLVSKITPDGIISTFVGTGVAGYSGDGGLATLAKINNPQGIAIDSRGNLFIAEVNNNVVRKVVISTGFISTYAGNGTLSESGDGGPATAASIVTPSFLCVDDSGNLYISDEDSKIRKVSAATGIITTVAGRGGAIGFSGDGGPADSAQFNGPSGICTDSVGNLFIADYYNNRIRKVESTTGIISTIAGGTLGTYNGEGLLATDAQLNPIYICFDSYGDLFVADEGNNRVRKIDTAGHIYTVAGDGTGAFSGENSPASSAEIFNPFGVSFDSCGNLYIVDHGNERIRKVDFSRCSVNTTFSVDLEINQGIFIFPNPVCDKLTIKSNNKIAQITITNFLGQTIYEGLFESDKVEINVSTIPPGLYVIHILDVDGKEFVRKGLKE